MNDPRVSVIVPIYHVEGFLSRCLRSLIHQTFCDIEIICVDDCGTDGSVKIAERFAEDDARIRILRHAENKGLAASRNTGMQAAHAPYIMFCDSDDYYAPDMVEKMLRAIEEGVDYAVCGVDIEYLSDENMRKSDARYYSIKYQGIVPVNENTLLNTDASVWNKIFRRSVIEEYGIRFPEGLMYEDTYFFIIYGMHAQKAYYTSKKLYHYQRHASSIMSQTFSGKSDYLTHFLLIGEKIFEYLAEKKLIEKHAKLFCRLYFSLLNSALGFEKNKENKERILDQAAQFWDASGLCIEKMRDFEYEFALLRKRITVGSVRKKMGGLLRIKYKAHFAKYCFCGIPFMRTRAVM